MRHLVTDPFYLLRKSLDSLLAKLFRAPPPPPASALSSTAVPSNHTSAATTAIRGWLPLYTMVSFRADISYALALRTEKKQKRIVERMVWGVSVGLIGGIVGGVVMLEKWGVLGRRFAACGK